jgi:transcriptional regulator with XRE-family HTH domain
MTTMKTDTQTLVAEACSRLVRQVLAENNWRAAQLAEELGVHPDLVRRWVRGERMLQLDDLLTVASMIDASLDTVFGLERSRKRAGELEVEQLADSVARAVVRNIGKLLIGTQAAIPELATQHRRAGEGPEIEQAGEQIASQSQQALSDLIKQAEPKRKRRSA